MPTAFLVVLLLKYIVENTSTDLPGADNTVMESVDHVKDVRFSEWHLALLGGVVVEMRPEIRMSEGIMIYE